MLCQNLQKKGNLLVNYLQLFLAKFINQQIINLQQRCIIWTMTCLYLTHRHHSVLFLCEFHQSHRFYCWQRPNQGSTTLAPPHASVRTSRCSFLEKKQMLSFTKHILCLRIILSCWRIVKIWQSCNKKFASWIAICCGILVLTWVH